MYSAEWFDTFAATVPASITEAEVDGISAGLPRDQYARILDVGCGIGRLSWPLTERGYTMTGIDINVDALLSARRSSPGPRFVALDQKHVGLMRWQFDGAILMRNSLGFVGRGTDLEMMAGLAGVIRPGGKVVLDLYHPEWLRLNQRTGEPDLRGAVVRRWMSGNRCFNEIRFASGQVDDIQFDVYEPGEIATLMTQAGFAPDPPMVWWNPSTPPDGSAPRYQLVCTRS